MKVDAVNLAESPIVDIPWRRRAANRGNKESQWAERDQGDDDKQHNGRQFKGHQIRAVMEDILTPRGPNGSSGGERNRREGN